MNQKYRTETGNYFIIVLQKDFLNDNIEIYDGLCFLHLQHVFERLLTGLFFYIFIPKDVIN